MPVRPFTEQNCSIASALTIVGERWTLLVMRDVLLGRRRFADLKRSLGVAPNILSDRLGTLVDHGLLERHLYSEHPQSYEYRPTQKGRDINPVLVSLMQWGDQHATPEGGPPRVFVHTACGHDAHPAHHCSHCGETLGPRDLKVRPGPGARKTQEESQARGARPLS
jgi:DNA-binding HxlR family transcriptional regulator